MDASLADPGRMRTGCDALASGGEGVVRSAVVHPGETGLGLCSKARSTEIKVVFLESELNAPFQGWVSSTSGCVFRNWSGVGT